MIDVLPVGLAARAFNRIVVIVTTGEHIATTLLEAVVDVVRVAGPLIEMVPHVLEAGETIDQFISATLRLLLGHGIISMSVQMLVKSTGYPP